VSDEAASPDDPSRNGEKPRKDTRFQPGHKKATGRPAGSRNNATIMLEKMMADDGAAVVQAVLTAAQAGDMTAARLVLDRICPPRKSRAIHLDLPVIETAQDVLKALAVTVEAMGSGEIGPDEAATVAGVLECKRRALETVEIEARLAALEARSEGK
jgi:hypothetical protein